MRAFEDLGRRVERAFRAADHDERALPKIAAAALREARIPDRIRGDDVLRWLFTADTLPEQEDLEGSFGQPPITVYQAPRFHVQVLFWLHGSTTIHQHGFTGAFQVLEGSSLHSRYAFHLRRRVSGRFLVGDVRLRSAELLGRGDVVEIRHDLIHGLFHLEAPSATIVVRTHGEPEGSPQYEYHPPSIAVDPFFEDPVMIRRLQGLRLLLQREHPDYLHLAEELIARSDLHTAHEVLEQAHRERDDAEGAARLIAAARKRHGDVVLDLVASIEEGLRRRSIHLLRPEVQDPDQRFFLSLLQNLPDRDAVEALVSERFPRGRARTRVIAWARALTGVDRIGVDLDDDLNLALFRHLVDGASGPALLDRLGDEFEPRQVKRRAAAITRHAEKLQKTMLGPLFRSGGRG